VSKILNLTPHTVTIFDFDPAIPPIHIVSSGLIARVETVPDVRIGAVEFDGFSVPLAGTALGSKITGLPEREYGVTFIVSRLVYDAAGARGDLVIPHGLARDADGAVIGCRMFARPVSSQSQRQSVLDLFSRLGWSAGEPSEHTGVSADRGKWLTTVSFSPTGVVTYWWHGLHSPESIGDAEASESDGEGFESLAAFLQD